jgi:predicted ArsR family transcriptional regulator
VKFEDRPAGKGRPARWWSLSGAGHARFPDRHSDVVTQLLTQVQAQFGEDAIDKLIAARESSMLQQYRLVLVERGERANVANNRAENRPESRPESRPDNRADMLAEKLAALAAMRTQEGYMAELVPAADGVGWELIEHHCSICAAANQCQAFCRSELSLFSQLVPEVDWQRTEHLMNAGRRCIYRITPKN